MPTAAVEIDRAFLKKIYEEDEQRYLASLPLEHFMESTYQSTQRKITMESLDLVSAMWPEFQVFSELLIQYPLPGEHPHRPRRVVPDNMVIVHSEPIAAVGSFMTPVQPVLPILVLEYVSQGNQRKDYEDNYWKYEHELKIPYYLVFKPENEDLRVYHRENDEYTAVAATASGRLPIVELDLEVAVLDGWVRFWFRGELLPLPGDLLNSLTAEREARIAAEEGRDAAEAARIAAEAAKFAAEAARIAAEAARIAAEQSLAGERAARAVVEEENARLRELLAKRDQPPIE